MKKITGPDLGAFTIDPRTPEYQVFRPLCDPGSPSKCLIATWCQIYTGHRLRVHVNHENAEGYYSITYSDYTWTKFMSEAEYRFAAAFDLGFEDRPLNGPKKPLTVSVDLSDGTWNAKPKRGPHTHGGPTGSGLVARSGQNLAGKTIRQRTRAALLARHRQEQAIEAAAS